MEINNEEIESNIPKILELLKEERQRVYSMSAKYAPQLLFEIEILKQRIGDAIHHDI